MVEEVLSRYYSLLDDKTFDYLITDKVSPHECIWGYAPQVPVLMHATEGDGLDQTKYWAGVLQMSFGGVGLRSCVYCRQRQVGRFRFTSLSRHQTLKLLFVLLFFVLLFLPCHLHTIHSKKKAACCRCRKLLRVIVGCRNDEYMVLVVIEVDRIQISRQITQISRYLPPSSHNRIDTYLVHPEECLFSYRMHSSHVSKTPQRERI